MSHVSADVPVPTAKSACAITTLSLLFGIGAHRPLKKSNTYPSTQSQAKHTHPHPFLRIGHSQRNSRRQALCSNSEDQLHYASLALVGGKSSSSASFSCSSTVLVRRSRIQSGFCSSCGKTQIAPLDLIKIGSGPLHELLNTSFHLTSSFGRFGSKQCCLAALCEVSSKLK